MDSPSVIRGIPMRFPEKLENLKKTSKGQFSSEALEGVSPSSGARPLFFNLCATKPSHATSTCRHALKMSSSATFAAETGINDDL